MNKNELYNYWKSEEEKAHINGWDFSYIEGRYDSEENDLPWDYRDVINKYRKDSDKLLDIDTGGGEFLISLGHPCKLTYATENYPPNVQLCREKFSKLGIGFEDVGDYSHMPYPDECFDIVINRHGEYDPKEIFRILKKGGVFITQQVGEGNDRELVELLLPDVMPQFGGHDLAHNVKKFKDAGFSILEQNEAFRPIRFLEVGALVWFARIIEWEFVGFSVDKCFENLLRAEEIIGEKGCVEGTIHRFFIAAQKTNSDFQAL